MEQIYDAIKLKQMDKFVLYLSSIDISDEEQIEPILYRCIKANNIAPSKSFRVARLNQS